MAHEHTVIDSDKHFSINPITREITNDSGKVVLIQHDHDSERFTFKIPKTVDGHDMSLCNVVQIHYLNIEASSGTTYADLYEVGDLKAAADNVTCSWLISRNATQYVGSLNFVVYFSCVDDEGNVTYAWSTAPHKGVTVSSGIHNSEVVVAEYSDVMEQWRKELVLANIMESYTPETACEELGAATKEYCDSKHVNYTATISINWMGSEAPYTQSVSVAGILATDKPHITPVYATALETALAQKEAWQMISKAETAANSIIFTCFEDKPATSIPVEIEVNR